MHRFTLRRRASLVASLPGHRPLRTTDALASRVECKVDYDVTNREGCLDDCSTELPDPATAKRWGSCVEALSCQRIRDGQYMNYGPLGECATRARTGR